MPSIGNAAAELAVVVTADTRAAETGLASLGQKVQGAGSAIAGLAAGAAVAGITALAGGLAGAVTAAAGFEQAMSAIQAVSGATGGEMQQLSSLALQLGKDTSFSASEAAAGIGELVKAGVGIGDVLGGAAAAALNLAAAGGLSVAEAATIASNAMNTFNLSGADMGHVADVIAGAANSSAIDVHDFGMSLSAVGAVASTIGVGFEDLAIAVAVMGQAGLKGSDAGTSLKTMLLNLSPSSNRARDAMKELGLITADGANQFFGAEGKAKSLSEIAGVLQNALKGLTKEQQIQTLQTIFGTDAIRAAAIMAKLGAEGFDEMAASMGKVTAADVAATRLDNLIGSFEQLKGSLETFAITVGSAFLPMLKAGVDGLTAFVNSLIPLADEWGPRIAQTITDIGTTIQQVFAGDWSPDATIAPLTNAIGQLAVFVRDMLLPPLMALGSFLADHTEIIIGFGAALLTIVGASAVISVITGIAAAVAFLLSPIGLVAAAVGLLVAAWIGDWGGIQEKTQAVIDFITPYVIQGLQAIQDFWTAWGPTILAAASAAWDGIKAVVTTAVSVIGEVIKVAVALWQGDFATAWAAIQADAGPAWDGITTTVQTAMGNIGQSMADGWAAATTTTAGLLDTLKTTVKAVWDLIPEDIRADLVLIGTHIATNAPGWITGMATAGQGMLDSFGAKLQLIVDAVSTWATTTVLAPIQALVGTATSTALQVGQGIWTSITTKLAEVVAWVQTWATTTFLAPLRNLASTVGDTASSIGTAIVRGIISGVQSMGSALGSVLGNLVRGALQQAKDALDIRSPSGVFADEVGRPIVEGIMDGLDSLAPKLTVQMAGLVRPPGGMAAMTGSGSAGSDSFDYERLAGLMSSRQVNVYGAGTEDVTRKVLGHLRRESLLEVGAFG